MSYNLYRISGYITLYFSKVNRNMKNLKKTILLLFICGVFGDEVKKVSVMEGESVTLNSNLTDIHTYSYILWRFDSERIAEISDGKISYRDVLDGSFTDRLQLNSETASLTITNIKMKHSGVYKLAAIGNSGTTYKKFNVSVYESPSAITVGEVEIKSVSVTPGNPLTLPTDVLHPRDQLIVWRFGEEGKLIAKADLEGNNSLHEDIDERFRDRLKLNNKTGSLTINNMRNTDSGLYIVKISSSKQTLHKRFSVTVIDSGWSPGAVVGTVAGVLLAVFAAVAAAGFLYHRWKVVKTVQNEGKKLTLSIPDGIDLQKDDLILWMFGPKGSVIAKFDRVIKINTTYDGPDGIFKDKLKLDEKTGSLTITNIKPEHAGVYELQLSNSERTINRKFKFKVPERAQSYTPEMRRAQSNTPELRRTQSAELIKPPTISEELKKLRTDQSNTPDQCSL